MRIHRVLTTGGAGFIGSHHADGGTLESRGRGREVAHG
jgi:nucleoside-diphosphate-sugar epimerase